MPSLGADMDAGTVVTWLVGPGDVVQRGDIVAVVETEKSTIEVEIFEAGVIEELLVPAGDRVPVGTVLAHVGVPGGAAGDLAVPPSALRQTPRPSGPVDTGGDRIPAASGAGMVVSPVVRHLAERLGVDVHSLDGSGPGGTITRADVEGAAIRPVSPAVVAVGEPGPVAGGLGRPSPAPTTHRGHPSATGVRSSPLARRMASELGVDIGVVDGSGPGGAVVEGDVRRAAPVEAQLAPRDRAPVTSGRVQGAPAGGAGSDDRQAAMRKAIGAMMARSKREIPHYYLSATVDMSRAVAWLEAVNTERPVTARLVASALLVKATARAVASVPEMNGFMVGDTFEPSTDVHVGVAVSLRTGGVIAPALHHADQLSLDELMAALRDLVNRARKGILRSSEMSDPTITVTNLGDLGVDSVFGVIYPPQVALVGFGRVAPRPWAADGMVGVRASVTATLSGDHRASDGHRGGRFLATIDHLLQRPEDL